MNDNDLKKEEKNLYNQVKNLIKVEYDIEYSFVRIIEKEIALAKSINYIMKTLIFRSDFSLVDMFSQLDSHNLNYLSPNK